jgi:hypothetical protein
MGLRGLEPRASLTRKVTGLHPGHPRIQLEWPRVQTSGAAKGIELCRATAYWKTLS